MPSQLSIYVHKYSLQKIEGKIKNWTIQRHGHRGAQYVDRKQTKQKAQQRKLKPRTKWTPPKKRGGRMCSRRVPSSSFLCYL